GPVDLLAGDAGLGGRGDAEVATLLVVEDGCEDAGRVEMRQAEPVDGPVTADQGRGVHVADKAVVFNGQVGHKLLRRVPLRQCPAPIAPPLRQNTPARRTPELQNPVPAIVEPWRPAAGPLVAPHVMGRLRLSGGTGGN